MFLFPTPRYKLGQYATRRVALENGMFFSFVECLNFDTMFAEKQQNTAFIESKNDFSNSH